MALMYSEPPYSPAGTIPIHDDREAAACPLRAISVRTSWATVYCVHSVKVPPGWRREGGMHREYLLGQGCTGLYTYSHGVEPDGTIGEVNEVRFANPATAMAFKLRFG